MDEPGSVSILQSWALKTPDWSVDARGLSVIPFLAIGSVALIFDPLLAALLAVMLFLLIFALSVEPLSGFFLIFLAPLAGFFISSLTGAIVSGSFIILLIGIGLLWTLRSIRFEMKRAERISGR